MADDDDDEIVVWLMCSIDNVHMWAVLFWTINQHAQDNMEQLIPSHIEMKTYARRMYTILLYIMACSHGLVAVQYKPYT